MHLATGLPSALAIVRGNERANERPKKLENIENLERFGYAARIDRKVPHLQGGNLGGDFCLHCPRLFNVHLLSPSPSISPYAESYQDQDEEVMVTEELDYACGCRTIRHVP